MAATVFLAACETATIEQIKTDPAKYRNKTVRVDGTVTTSFGILQTGAYEVEDATGKIFVISNKGIPARGARVTVVGTVFNGAMVGGQAVGTAIRETEHKVK
jgi:hypothetical protein